MGPSRGLAQGQVQGLIQHVLEEEVTEFLGRAKSARRSGSDSDSGYRNGHSRSRKLTLSSGTIRVRRPRVRDTEERFESRLLPLFVKRSRQIAELIPELYLHGLSEGDFDLRPRTRATCVLDSKPPREQKSLTAWVQRSCNSYLA